MTAPLGPGRKLGPYRITGLLGKGGMGAVWRATDEVRGGEVALKTIHGGKADTPDEEAVQRFLREARLACSVEHEHLVRVLFAGELDGQLVIAQELVTGGNLHGLIAQRGRLHWRDAARLGIQIALGLGAIHRAGLVHRDLKPANVLLDGEGRAKIADFGLARHADQSTVLLTAPGAVLGTLEYMAPEQAGDNHEVTNRSDLYALGCTLHALLTGAPPFPGTGMTVIARHLGEAPRPPSVRGPGIPPAMDELVLRLLAKPQSQRPASGEEVAQALHVMLASGGGRRTAERRAEKDPGRGRGAILASAGLIALAAVAAAAIALRPGTHATGPGGAPPGSATATTTPAPPPVSRDPLAEARERYPDQLPWLRLVGVLGGLDLKTPGDASTLCVLPGNRVATLGKALHLFDLTSGRELARAPQPVHRTDPDAPPPPPPPDMDGAVLLADGRLVSGEGAGLLAWDLAATPPRAELLRPLRLSSIASAASAAVLVGTSGTRLHLLRLDDRARDAVLDLNKEGPARAVAIAPDGARLWVALAKTGVIELDIRLGLSRGRLLAGTSPRATTALALSPDGGRLLAGSTDGLVAAWDVSGEAAEQLGSLEVWEAKSHPVGTIAFAPEGDRVVVTEWDVAERSNPTSGQGAGARSAWLLELGPGGPAQPRQLGSGAHTWMVSDARFGPGGQVVTVGMDHALRVFDAASGELRLSPQGHAHWPMVLALSPDERTLASGGMDGSVRVWDLTTGQERAAAPRAHRAYVNGLAWAADGEHLASCSVRGEVGWWRADLTRELDLPPGGPGDGTGVAVVGPSVLVSFSDAKGGGGILRWTPPERKSERLALGSIGDVTRLARWDDGCVALGTYKGELALLDLTGPEPTQRFGVPLAVTVFEAAEGRRTPSQVFQLAADPAGQRLAGSVGSGYSGCLDMDPRGSRIPVLTSSPDQGRWVRGLALHPGKPLAASSSEDGSVRVWDTTSGVTLTELLFPPGFGDAPSALALTTGGRLFVGTYGGVILEYELRQP